MSKKEAVLNGIKIAEKYGFTIPYSLANEINAAENSKYRIAVAGKFQVGKSTLINKVFLSDNPILIEGEGLCTTSINTEIEYAPTRKLELFRWEDSDKLTETTLKEIENPTMDDLKSSTVGKDRLSLSKSISKVKLYEPNESLHNYTIIDTPGIDDPDYEILQNTTFRIIPSSDIAIVVVEPRQLDQTELDLIRCSMVKQGLSKLMVLVSYKPELKMSEAQRTVIVETIKAQLASCGQANIPVDMYCFDNSLEDILCDTTDIRLAIGAFLADNAIAGREERIATHVKNYLNTCLVEIATKLKNSTLSEEEKAILKKKLDNKIKATEDKYKALINDINNDIDKVKSSCTEKIKLAVGDILANYLNDLRNSEDIDSLKAKLADADKIIRWNLLEGISKTTEDIEKRVRNVLENHMVELKNISMELESFISNEFHIDGGVFSKIPNIVFELLNVISLDLFIPGGFLLALVARIIQVLLPSLNKIALQNLAKIFIIKKVESTFNTAEVEISENIIKQINDNLDKTKISIKKYVHNQYNDSIQAINSGLEAEQTDKSKLENIQAELQNAINAL